MRALGLKQFLDYANAQFGDIPIRVGSREKSIPVTGVWVPETVNGKQVLILSTGGQEIPEPSSPPAEDGALLGRPNVCHAELELSEDAMPITKFCWLPKGHLGDHAVYPNA